jgi:hypothetical protein
MQGALRSAKTTVEELLAKHKAQEERRWEVSTVLSKQHMDPHIHDAVRAASTVLLHAVGAVTSARGCQCCCGIKMPERQVVGHRTLYPMFPSHSMHYAVGSRVRTPNSISVCFTANTFVPQCTPCSDMCLLGSRVEMLLHAQSAEGHKCSGFDGLDEPAPLNDCCACRSGWQSLLGPSSSGRQRRSYRSSCRRPKKQQRATHTRQQRSA